MLLRQAHSAYLAAAEAWQGGGGISTLVSLRAWRGPAGTPAASLFSPALHSPAGAACQQRSIACTSALRETEVQDSRPTLPHSAARASPAAAAAGAPAQPARPASPQGLAAVPSVARTLGFAGAIPFVALSPPIAAALPLLPADLVANAALLQIGYGATIASFLGGIHWAMAMSAYGGRALSAAHKTERYIWSVTPCLMAWPAVTLQPGPGSLIVGATLGIVYAVDRSFAAKGLLPSWYMALRLPLTVAAVGGMLCTLTGSLLYGDQPRKK